MRTNKTLAIALLPVASLLLSGCGFFPSSGPRSDVITDGVSKVLPYYLRPLNAEAVEILSKTEPSGLAGAFTDRRPPANLTFGIGDIVSVSVFEAAAGGLFIPSEAGVRPGNFVQLPDQAVDNDGNISVPYAGVIRAAGRTNVQVQNAIIERIKNRAIEPQVVVSLASQRTNLISVIGEVASPTRYAAAASGAGDRVTDAIARAGGIRGQGYETWVVLERNSKRATVPFENLIMNPANNIYVLPGDRIYVYREQQKFLAFGASGQQGEFTFDAWRINLAEAVAKAGGLLDNQADASAVFLYRREPRAVAARLGAKVENFQGDTIPVIFQVNLADPAGYFLATHTLVRNQDVVFAANAKETDVNKVIGFASNIASSAYYGGLAVSQGVAVKNVLR